MAMMLALMVAMMLALRSALMLGLRLALLALMLAVEWRALGEISALVRLDGHAHLLRLAGRWQRWAHADSEDLGRRGQRYPP